MYAGLLSFSATLHFCIATELSLNTLYDTWLGFDVHFK